jgi:regulator of cell morphogenesis and NO signaling
MLNGLNKATTVGQLVAERPLRAAILEQYGIDYCCGGKIPLEQACATKGINVDEVLEKIAAADDISSEQAGEPDWTKTSLKALVDHIIRTYHEPLRQELPRVAQMALKVAKVHGDNHPEMVKVLQIFNAFRAQLELHMQKEEMILFPGIVTIEKGSSSDFVGCGSGIAHPIQMMMMEHDEAGEALKAMSTLTNKYQPPADACNTFKVLLDALSRIESEMHRHVHKENSILFPRALEAAQPKTACT